MSLNHLSSRRRRATAPRRRVAHAVLAAVAALAVTLGGTTPAYAATTKVTGTANCTGSWVKYDTVRRTTSGPVETYLTKAATSARNGHETTIGIRIDKTGALHQGTHPFADTWARQVASGRYYEGTAFTMRAKMKVSRGACNPTWAATLHH